MEQLQTARTDLDNSSLAVEYLQKQNGELLHKLDEQEQELITVKFKGSQQDESSLRDMNQATAQVNYL